MRTHGLKALAAAGLALALAATDAAQAQEQMVLNCQVQSNRPDHGRTRWTRRITISPSSRTVRILDDFGAGFTPRNTFAFVSMTPQRITLEQSAGKVSFIDRKTGEYVLRNPRARFTVRGRCTGAS
ncbi:MAG TPA: hypothetical protein VGH03_08915 [Caulobacteraceae bacterium]|jgi:hypothetical protein